MITCKSAQLRSLWVLAFIHFGLAAGVNTLAAQRVPLATHVGFANVSVLANVTDIDTGALPASQMLTLTVRLQPDADRETALKKLIEQQQTVGSTSYRQWLTTDEFAGRFGATDKEIASASAWFESQGLTVSAVSPSKLRLTISGSSAAVAAAFHVQFQSYRTISALGASGNYFANLEEASLPEDIAALVAGVSGLDNRASAQPMELTGLGSDGAIKATGDSLAWIEETVDENTVPIIIVKTQGCSYDFFKSDVAAYEAILQQAEAQGVTVLAANGCGDKSFPAVLAEVTAVAIPAVAIQDSVVETGVLAGNVGPQSLPLDCAQNNGNVMTEACLRDIEARPSWQTAVGLPDDGMRKAPDVSSDAMALAQTLAGISRHASARLGNIGPVLYSVAKRPGLFSQPDGAATGTWEPSTGLGQISLAELAKALLQGTTGTSSLLVPSSYAPAHGTNVTLTATVTSTGGSGVPTGTVTFTSTQKGTLGTASLNSAGVATFTTNQLPAGRYTTTSVYGGDATYAGSTSGVATITVVGEVSVITAMVAPGAAVGGNASIAVSVTSGSGVGAPSGTVTVSPQGTKNLSTAMASLTSSNGTATGTVLLPVYEAGQFTLLVSCSDPDPSFTCDSPISTQVSVGKGVTTTTLGDPSVNPAVGATYTLTAMVAGSTSAATSSSTARRASAGSAQKGVSTRNATTGSAPTSNGATNNGPTGNVQFMDGTTYLGTAAISSGAATYSGTATSATHSFNAMYSGDQNYGTSSSNAPAAAGGLLPTSTSLTASSYAIATGQTITFYSTIFSPGVPSTMTGTVTYSAVAQGVLGTGTVSGGLATLTLPGLSPGTYVMTATYSGDATFAGSASVTTVIVTVAGGVATLSGSFNPPSVPYGSDAVLTATASFPAGSIGGPTGQLVATVAGVSGAVYTQSLIVSATTPTSAAIFTFPAPPPGIYTVTISCPPADTFTCTAPVKIPLTVVRGNTATALTLSPPGPLAGQPVTLTATISNLGNDPKANTFTGTVQFFANNQLLGTAVVNGVTASLIAALPAGAEESITALYSGDVDWTTSVSTPIVITVAALPTTIVVSSNVTNAISGVKIELTATVTNIAGGPLATTAPSGVASFYDTYNGVVSEVGTAPLVSQGANTSIAMLNATGLTTGTHSVYAVYIGDMIYLGSTSPAITIGSTNFGVTFVPAMMTLNQGQAGTATLVVNFQGGFSGSVSFGCQPPPNVQITCSFSPAVLTADGTTTLNIGTVVASAGASSGQSSASRVSGSSGLGGRFAGGAALAMVLLWIRPRRRISGIFYAALVLMVLAGTTGCTGTNGASSSVGTTAPPATTPTVPGSSLGTQILTITTAGSDGNNTVRHDFQYQVTVQ